MIRASGAVTVLPGLAFSDLPDDVTIVTGIDVGFERDVEFFTRAALRTSTTGRITRPARSRFCGHPMVPGGVSLVQ